MRRVKVYGWQEMNAVCCDITEMTIREDGLQNRWPDGAVTVALGDGEWFASFGAAKREAIRRLQNQIDEAQLALKLVRKTTKDTLEKLDVSHV